MALAHKRYLYGLLAHYAAYYLPKAARVVEVSPISRRFHDAIRDRDVTVADPLRPDLFAPEETAPLDDLRRAPPDRVLLSGCLHFAPDIQNLLERVQAVCTPDTRVVLTYFSRLWKPVFGLASRLGLADTGPEQNWLAPSDIRNVLELAGFELVAESQRVLVPVYVPLLSAFLNRWVAPLPGFRLFTLANIAVARPKKVRAESAPSVSIIIPARNERGNIARLLQRLPVMSPNDEVIFVEGHSSDGTWAEIERVVKAAAPGRRLLMFQQQGAGKGDAVRLAFSKAQGEILMILDADLSVPPEILPKFYRAIVNDTGEFINGSRLVYPMEKRAMRFANILGNKFFAATFSALLGQPLKDTLCGTKVLRRSHYEAIARDRGYFGDFDPFGDFDLIFGAARQGLRIVELPVRYAERVYGTTNIRRWAHGWLLLRMSVFAAKRIKFI